MVYSDDGLPLGRHMVGDVFETLENMKANDLWPELAVFHPSCTYLTNSAEWAYSDPDFERYPGAGYHQKPMAGTLVGKARREARESAAADFMRIVRLPIKKKIIENPVGAMSRLYRKPDQILQPNWFGDDASKATAFWLFNVDPIIPTQSADARLVCAECLSRAGYNESYRCSECGAPPRAFRQRWANQTNSGQNRLPPSVDRWKDRSRTFPGLADALVDQVLKPNPDLFALVY